MTDCPYCDALDAFALLPAEPVTSDSYYEINPEKNTGHRRQSSNPRTILGHKMRFPIACQPDYSIECKRGAA